MIVVIRAHPLKAIIGPGRRKPHLEIREVVQTKPAGS